MHIRTDKHIHYISLLLGILVSSCAPTYKYVRLDDVYRLCDSGGEGCHKAAAVCKNQKIYFKENEDIIDDEDKLILDQLIACVKSHPDVEILELSHANKRGTNAYNQALSERRAQAVLNYLTNHGLDRSRIKIYALGETQPEVTGDSESALAQNRRVELVVTDEK